MAHEDIGISKVSKAINEKRGWFIALGIILVLIGAVAVIWPFFATLSTALFVGWVLIAGGIAQVIHAFWVKDWGGFIWAMLIGLLETAAGIALLTYPVEGIVALTIYMAIVFIAEGALRIIMAFGHKPHAGWVWLLIGGIVSIGVGVMLWAKLPSSALWAIGLLVGVNVTVAGWTLLMLAFAARNLPDPEAKV
ncbi:MAG: HdeD family acid-resistance protein [Hyphomicrobiales bacterium]